MMKSELLNPILRNPANPAQLLSTEIVSIMIISHKAEVYCRAVCILMQMQPTELCERMEIRKSIHLFHLQRIFFFL